MSTLHFVVHPLPGTEDQLNDRIREVADKINKYGVQILPALQSLKVPVKQIVVGPAHLGILLEDGRAFRVAFSIIPERLDLSKQDPNKASGSGGTGGSGTGAGGGGGGGGSQSNNNSSKNSPASRQCRSRARIMRTSNSVRGGSSSQGSGSRSTGVIMGGSGSAGNRSLVSVPAPFVPEELVTQAQVVLQGKSRNLIIRELQRTNLDVNLAVNNLLSRDDEGGDDTEEGSDNYVAEDLISLLDGGFHADNSVIIDAEAMFSEDMFGFSNIRNLMLYSRARSERTQQNSSSSSSSAAAAAAAAAVGGGAAGGTGGGSGSGSGGATKVKWRRFRWVEQCRAGRIRQVARSAVLWTAAVVPEWPRRRLGQGECETLLYRRSEEEGVRIRVSAVGIGRVGGVAGEGPGCSVRGDCLAVLRIHRGDQQG